jgi:uncharacterized protein (DUF58 family)
MQPLFEPDFLTKYQALGLIKDRDNGVYGEGLRKGRHKGNSLQFSDFRQYVPGDDIRKIDYHVLARLDHLVVKLYDEEKQGVIHLFLDCSISMAFSAPEKGAMALRLAAAIACIYAQNRDVVVIILIDEQGERKRFRVSHPGYLPGLLDFLRAVKFDAPALNVQAMQRIKLPSRGISIVISDFFFEEPSDSFYEMLRYLRMYSKQQVTAIRILSQQELHPDLDGEFILSDCESKENWELVVDKSTLELYQQAMQQLSSVLMETARRHGCLFVDIEANSSLTRVVQKVVTGR